MAQQTILVVDDEANIRELAEMYLVREGYLVRTASDGLRALEIARDDPPDLMVLDLMLPGLDGREVCRQVRAGSNLPILMLTARDDDFDKILGLEMGADDYMTKPFNPRELVARVRAILRRIGAAAADAAPDPAATRRLGDIAINPASREVTVSGAIVPLRTKEFDLLLTFIDHVNIVLSREQLLNLVWGYDFYGQTRTVDVHVAHLREKLSASRLQIETVWGMGYKLVERESTGTQD